MKSATSELISRIVLKWIEKRPFSAEGKARRQARRQARRAARKARRHGPNGDSDDGQFTAIDEGMGMDTLKGAAKSKLIWLGLGQVVWGLVQLWAHDGLTWDSAMPVIGGGATIVFRAMTDESLASKGAAAPAE